MKSLILLFISLTLFFSCSGLNNPLSPEEDNSGSSYSTNIYNVTVTNNYTVTTNVTVSATVVSNLIESNSYYYSNIAEGTSLTIFSFEILDYTNGIFNVPACQYKRFYISNTSVRQDSILNVYVKTDVAGAEEPWRSFDAQYSVHSAIAPRDGYLEFTTYNTFNHSSMYGSYGKHFRVVLLNTN